MPCSGAQQWEEALTHWGINFDAEAYKYVADELVRAAGVQVLFHTLVTGVIVEHGNISAVIVENKSGRQAICAKVFIDATGDADVASQAGVPTTQGRAFDGQVQSMGSFIHLGGMPALTPSERKDVLDRVRQAVEAGRLPFYNPGFLNVNDMGHGDHTSPNMTRAAADPTNAQDLTRAELDIRRNAWDFVSFLRQEVLGFDQVYIQGLPVQVGVRESRQVLGKYVLTGDDIRQGRRFSDSIARGSWWIDIHCPLGNTMPVHLCVKECPQAENCPYWAAEHENMLSKESLYPPKGGWYENPLRCLVPSELTFISLWPVRLRHP